MFPGPDKNATTIAIDQPVEHIAEQITAVLIPARNSAAAPR